MAERVTLAEVDGLGWNSIAEENHVLTARVFAEQLNLIGRLLIEIRDALAGPP